MSLKAPKKYAPTRIINENKHNHRARIQALKTAVRALIKWRLHDRYGTFTCNGVEQIEEGMFRAQDKHRNPKIGVQLSKVLPWADANHYMV